MKTDQSVLQFVGLSALAPAEKEMAMSVVVKGLEKVERHVKRIDNMTIHIKGPKPEEEEKEKRHRHSVIIRLQCEQGLIEASANDQFELEQALHTTFHELIAQVEHKAKKR